VQLIYYAHSYRKTDDDVNEFFQDLMVDEALTPSLDPPSDRLNGAKPERHLRSTDAMIVVLPQRGPGPSEYIRWEIGLGLRARRPQLVFVEDVLPDGLLPVGLLQRRFSRRRLLREARDHRHAVRTLKGYIGADPPPAYQPMIAQRRCAVIGSARLEHESLTALLQCLERRHYKAMVVAGRSRIPDEMTAEDLIQSAALCIVVMEGMTPADYYLLGAARAALTPTIALTLDPGYIFDPVTPREYQPRPVPPGDADALLRTLEAEISTFEEDYLDLKEEAQVRRYKMFRENVLQSQRREGVYSRSERDQIINYIENAEFDMSKDKVQVSNVVGPVNIKARLDHVTQTVQQTSGWPDDRRAELTKLLTELQAALEAAAEKRPEDAERVTKTAELVVAEATKAKPDKTFLSITAEGLKQAAQAVADIAPTVLAVAGKVAAFVAALH
jgi:hypothetical protein